MEKTHTWTYKPVDGGDPSKIVARLRFALVGKSIEKRDRDVMDYLRGAADSFKGPFYCDPRAICDLWESAYMAGVESQNPPEPTALANTPKPGARKHRAK